MPVLLIYKHTSQRIKLFYTSIKRAVFFRALSKINVFKDDVKNIQRKKYKIIFCISFKNEPTVGRQGARACAKSFIIIQSLSEGRTITANGAAYSFAI